VLAKVDADPCADARLVQAQAHSKLIDVALRRVVRQNPFAFSSPPVGQPSGPCIETDDLTSAGISQEQMSLLIQDSGRAKMRSWLNGLSPSLRSIFVLRAILGQDGEKTADSLRRTGAAGADGWKREQVGTAYREVLCSLARLLLSSQPAPAVA
jgi:hypothetical protein